MFGFNTALKDKFINIIMLNLQKKTSIVMKHFRKLPS